MNKLNATLEKSGCRFSPVKKSGNVYTYTADCSMKMPNGATMNSRSTSVLTVAGESSYKIEIDIVTDVKRRRSCWSRSGLATARSRSATSARSPAKEDSPGGGVPASRARVITDGRHGLCFFPPSCTSTTSAIVVLHPVSVYDTHYEERRRHPATAVRWMGTPPCQSSHYQFKHPERQGKITVPHTKRDLRRGRSEASSAGRLALEVLRCGTRS